MVIKVDQPGFECFQFDLSRKKGIVHNDEIGMDIKLIFGE
jgi:hypothetical protein